MVVNPRKLSDNAGIFGSVICLRNLRLIFVNVPRLGVVNAFLPHASLIIFVHLVKLMKNVLNVEVLFTLSHGGLLLFLA